ncbi:retinol dehydrogenase 8-like, partial [Orbicella faveolata]|uniref:retinol dehydrogenase 8-like n=1 Tax=Orbicella faveolata TaxID=48498 RepID=UPI0009E4981E
TPIPTQLKYHWLPLLYSIAVNNAGIGGMFTVVECTPMALAKELFEVNYFGALRLIQAVLPNMKARQSGHIISNSSTMGVVGTPFNELYCSTKFALEGLSEALAPTLLHFNIRCTILETGPTATLGPENSKAFLAKFKLSEADQKTKELLETFSGRMYHLFISTMQSPDEIAEVVREVILNEKPNLRYQTNEKYNPEEIKEKLVDPTGNALVQMVKKTFLDEE